MPTTIGWIKDNVYLATPNNPATANNGVLCARWKTIYAFPAVYYNCTHPYNPTGTEAHLADTINNLHPANIGVQLNTAGVNVYIMWDIKGFDSFFNATPPASLAGIYGNSSTANHNSATFLQTLDTNGLNPTPSPYVNGSIIHELAHQLDASWGNPSTKAPWTSLATPDFTNMNTADGVTRRPCTDVFTAATCAKFNLNTTSNAQIFFATYAHSNIELFAEIFEHQESDSVIPELENALTFLPQMNTYMTGVLAKAVPNGTP
jgi:hypothetical protein